MTTAERGFHPFAVLHVLRKTILLYLIPLVQVLFERNWQALWTALVQDAVLFTVLALVSAAALHASRWQVDAQGTLTIRWRLGVRLDRTLRAGQLAALTIERPLLYRLADASKVVLYPAGQKRILTLMLTRKDAQWLADRMMPVEDAVAHTPHGGEKLAFAVLGANSLSTMALLVLALRQSEPYAPDAQTAAFAHLNRLAAWAARWLPMGTAWLLVLGGVLFCASLARSAAQAAHYTVWRTDTQLGSRGGLVRRYELRIRLRHLSFADVRRSPATWALHYSPVYVTASRCQPEVPLLVWREDGPFLQELLPDRAGGHGRPQHPGVFSACRHPLRAVPAADGSVPLHPARAHRAAAGADRHCRRVPAGRMGGLPPRGRVAEGRAHPSAHPARLPSAQHLCLLPDARPDGPAVALGGGGAPHEPDPHLPGRHPPEGAQRTVRGHLIYGSLRSLFL